MKTFRGVDGSIKASNTRGTPSHGNRPHPQRRANNGEPLSERGLEETHGRSISDKYPKSQESLSQTKAHANAWAPPANVPEDVKGVPSTVPGKVRISLKRKS